MVEQLHRLSTLLSPKEFANRLSISRWTVYAWIQEGRIEAIKLGRLVRISEAELERIIEEGTHNE